MLGLECVAAAVVLAILPGMLIGNWRKASKFHSMRLAFFWGAFNGAVLGLWAFAGIINPWLFVGLNVIGYATIAVARVTKQPGLD